MLLFCSFARARPPSSSCTSLAPVRPPASPARSHPERAARILRFLGFLFHSVNCFYEPLSCRLYYTVASLSFSISFNKCYWPGCGDDPAPAVPSLNYASIYFLRVRFLNGPFYAPTSRLANLVSLSLTNTLIEIVMRCPRRYSHSLAATTRSSPLFSYTCHNNISQSQFLSLSPMDAGYVVNGKLYSRNLCNTLLFYSRHCVEPVDGLSGVRHCTE
jgi:hypothetical protein